nr:macro domain-containing protein [Pigmentibacter ruber]
MIENKYEDLLDSQTEALVNTVNCVGVMGKGIALQFKKAWPDNFKAYASACKKGEIRPGKMFVFETKNKLIINFPTKVHWKEKSKIDFIIEGLEDLVKVIEKYKIKSIALPPLGCGNGGLNWKDVQPLITKAFKSFPDVQVFLYPPAENRVVKKVSLQKENLKMTPGRAALLSLMHFYRGGAYPLTKIEIQKLAYFLQNAGEPLRLKYEKLHFGPYAENLNHALQNMEGHFILGFGDRQQRSEIRPVAHALEKAHEFLSEYPETRERIQIVSKLIEGFEDSFGLELLATVHWVLQNEQISPQTIEETTKHIHRWNERKKLIIKESQVAVAMKRLSEHNWIIINKN